MSLSTKKSQFKHEIFYDIPGLYQILTSLGDGGELLWSLLFIFIHNTLFPSLFIYFHSHISLMQLIMIIIIIIMKSLVQ